MERRYLIPLLVLGAALLIASGALAGVLLAEDDDGDRGPPKGAEKGYLGIRVSLVAGSLRVGSVAEKGPAAKAGIRVGDLIRAVEGKVVRTPEALRRAVEAKKPGERVSLTIERGDRELEIEVKLGEAPPGAQIEAPPVEPRRDVTPAPSGLEGLPQRLRELLQRQLDEERVTPGELLPLLRSFAQENVRVGRVVEASATALKIALLDGGSEMTIGLTPATAIRRAGATIQATDLQPGELVLVFSMDGGKMAFAVNAYGP